MQEEIINFINNFLDLFLIKRNANGVSKLLHDNVTWFNTDNENTYIGKKNVMDIIDQDIINYDFLFSINKTDLNITKLNEMNYLVYGTITIKLDKEHGNHDASIVRISSIVNHENKTLKLSHMHFSFAVEEQNIYKEHSLIDNSSATDDYLPINSYLKILKETNDVFFEYNIVKMRTTYSRNWANEFGYVPVTNEIASFTETIFFKSIHKDDRDIAKKALDDILDGARYAGIVIRMSNKNDLYNWYKVRLVSITDNLGMPYKTMGSIVDINIEMKKYELLSQKIDFDSLTGLLNKEAFTNSVSHAIMREQVDKAAIFFVDIDNFKYINDTHGHYFGDYILAEFAKCFKKVFRKNDLIGRVGGDEFMVFVKNISASMATKKANELLSEVNSIVIDETNNQFLMCSIGIAFYPNNADNFADLYKRSDQAQYYAKKQGKNRYALYD